MKLNELWTAAAMPPAILGLSVLVALGCENKEKVLDVETPGGQVEVERNRDTGAVDVDVSSKEDQLIDSHVPGADVEVDQNQSGTGVEVK
jgi:hypothetical protein